MIELNVDASRIMSTDIEEAITHAINNRCRSDLDNLSKKLKMDWDFANVCNTLVNSDTLCHVPFLMQSVIDSFNNHCGIIIKQLIFGESIRVHVNDDVIHRNDAICNILTLLIPIIPDVILSSLITGWTLSSRGQTFQRALCEYYFMIKNVADYHDRSLGSLISDQLKEDSFGGYASCTGVDTTYDITSSSYNNQLTTSNKFEDLCRSRDIQILPYLGKQRVRIGIQHGVRRNGDGLHTKLSSHIHVQLNVECEDAEPLLNSPSCVCPFQYDKQADRLICTLFHMFTENKRNNVVWMGTFARKTKVPILILGSSLFFTKRIEFKCLRNRFGFSEPSLESAFSPQALLDISYASLFLKSAEDNDIVECFEKALITMCDSVDIDNKGTGMVASNALFVNVIRRRSREIVMTMAPHCKCQYYNYTNQGSHTACGTKDLVACLIPIHALRLLELLVCGPE